jgi:hypothetical protein
VCPHGRKEGGRVKELLDSVLLIFRRGRLISVMYIKCIYNVVDHQVVVFFKESKFTF